MVKRFSNFMVLVCASLLLGACGGGGGGVSGGGGGGGGPAPDPRLARLDLFEAQRLRVLGDPVIGSPSMPLTVAAAIPIDGTASFNGSTTIRVELQADPLVLFGDATIDVDFGSGQVGGVLANFFGATSQARVQNYNGEITVSGGTPTQDMVLRYSGSLSASDQSLLFDGTLSTLFLGTSVTAIAASDLEAMVDHNGSLRDATLIVIGEGTVELAPAPDPDPLP